jgi:hypothetical protein
LVIAGVAIGVAAGVKLTVVLVFPILLLLTAALGWRSLRTLGVATAVPLLTVGAAGLLRNQQHTGHLLGNGGGRIDQEHDGSIGAAVVTAYRIAYRFLDLSGLGQVVGVLAVAGVLAGCAVSLSHYRRGFAPRCSFRDGALWALPLVSPLFVVVGAGVMKALADATNMDVNAPTSTAGAFAWGVRTLPNEDLSYFGVLGAGLALTSLALLALWATGRVPRRIATLALAIPLFVLLLAFNSSYNAFLGRFMLVPVALALPLVAYAWTQPFTIALAAVAAATLVNTAVNNEQKPLASSPWIGGRDKALTEGVEPALAASTATLDQQLRNRRCILAVVASDEPSYLLYGPNMERSVSYANSPNSVLTATSPVIIGPDIDASVLTNAGWTIHPARDYWRTARPPRPSGANDGCS